MPPNETINDVQGGRGQSSPQDRPTTRLAGEAGTRADAFL
jgi:hypothetical protein